MTPADVASSPSSSGIVELNALALAEAIRARTVSCVEVMRAYLAQIERLNPALNAIVSLRDGDLLLAEAEGRDRQLAAGQHLGPLHGLPLAVKDLEATQGIATTYGSPIFGDNIPEKDALPVRRMREAGGIIVGKTNVPEFGLGSQTYNTVFGATSNVYDLSRTSGGSSGGAAVAVASRMLPVADGSDHAGSLRNPAAFNNVFGLRPSPGRVPSDKTDLFLPSLTVLGPMARNVPDLAMLFGVMAGQDAGCPTSLPTDPALATPSLERDPRGLRIGWLGDLGGHLPFEDGILDLCRAGLRECETLGCIVEEARPDFPIEALFPNWLVLRGWAVASSYAALYRDPAKRALLKPEAVRDIAAGLALSAMDVTNASAARSDWYRAMHRLFGRYDLLALPSSQVFPFDKDTPWPRTVAGRAMDTYHRWLEVNIPATMAGSPAISVPVGFDGRGLPMGMQLIGPNRGDLLCLQVAHAYDRATNWIGRRPPPTLR